MTTGAPKKFVWIDLEMTGLDPQKDVIIEVAAIVTDSYLNEIATFASLISHDQEKLKKLFDGNDFWRSRPAEQKQIMDDIKTGKPSTEVESLLFDFIAQNCGDEAVYLAGNSIRVDRSFIDAQWPKVAKTLHYRMLDVTSFKLAWTGLGQVEMPKHDAHRALSDIRDSIDELRFYLTQKWPTEKIKK